MGVRGPDPYHPQRAQGTVESLVSDPSLRLLRHTFLRPTTFGPPLAYAAAATGALCSSCFNSSAQMMRTVLLSSATVTSMRGFRAIICSSHEPAGAPRLLACRDNGAASDDEETP